MSNIFCSKNRSTLLMGFLDSSSYLHRFSSIIGSLPGNISLLSYTYLQKIISHLDCFIRCVGMMICLVLHVYPISQDISLLQVVTLPPCPSHIPLLCTPKVSLCGVLDVKQDLRPKQETGRR